MFRPIRTVILSVPYGSFKISKLYHYFFLICWLFFALNICRKLHHTQPTIFDIWVEIFVWVSSLLLSTKYKSCIKQISHLFLRSLFNIKRSIKSFKSFSVHFAITNKICIIENTRASFITLTQIGHVHLETIISFSCQIWSCKSECMMSVWSFRVDRIVIPTV